MIEIFCTWSYSKNSVSSSDYPSSLHMRVPFPFSSLRKYHGVSVIQRQLNPAFSEWGFALSTSSYSSEVQGYFVVYSSILILNYLLF